LGRFKKKILSRNLIPTPYPLTPKKMRHFLLLVCFACVVLAQSSSVAPTLLDEHQLNALKMRAIAQKNSKYSKQDTTAQSVAQLDTQENIAQSEALATQAAAEVNPYIITSRPTACHTVLPFLIVMIVVIVVVVVVVVMVLPPCAVV